MRRNWAAVVVGALAGCLPEGGPGVGRQVVADRDLADVAFSRERSDGPGGYLLYTRANPAGDTSRDLYLAPRDGSPGRLRAVAVPPQVRSSYFWDDQGHLYLHRDVQRPQPASSQPPGSNWDLTTLDPLTSDPRSLGRSRLERISPARARLLVQRPDGSAVVRELSDGSERPVGDALRQSMFIGEDLYAIDGTDLVRLRAGGEGREVLLDEVSAFRPASDGTLVVRRPVLGGPREALASLGPQGTATPLVEASLIGDPFLSPDGRKLGWMSGSWPPQQLTDPLTVTVLDLDSRTPLTFTVPATVVTGGRTATDGHELPVPSVDVAFRPGTDEGWFSLSGKLFILGAAVALERPVSTGLRIGPARSGERVSDDRPAAGRRTRSSLFTADGRRWIFEGDDGRFHLGNAARPLSDDGIAVSTMGQAEDLLELDPGRRLAVWLSPGPDRTDLYVLDVAADQLRFLATDVGATLFGAHRVLAIARKVGDRRATGDLVLVDLDTGAETLLSHNVSEFAVPACSGCDATAPGAAFAYIVQARVPWLYEGLWTGELP
jgi:hypothetical protein